MTYLCETCIHRKPCMYEEIGVTSCTYYLQERPKGRWEKTKFAGEHLCSNCQAITYFEFIDKHGYKEYDFCPNCGADMRDNEEQDV